MWCDRLDASDQPPAATPQVAARRVGEDERVGCPEQRLVTRFAVLVVEVVVATEASWPFPDVRVYAQAAEARVAHLRTRAGEHGIDLIVEGADGRVVALEVKVAREVGDSEVKHLHWLKGQIGPDLLDAAVVVSLSPRSASTFGVHKS